MLATQFIRFLVVGSIVAVVQFGLLSLFVEHMGMDATYASSVGYVICSMLNYFMNRRFTFQARGSHLRSLVRFWAVALTGLLMNGALMKVSTEIFSLYYLYAQVVAIGCVILWNFFANRKWTFAE